jgi:uncharacterized protein (TIGR03382 family)
MTKSILLKIGLIAALTLAPWSHAELIGPTPYLSSADSPFSGGSFNYFHLETFEDHLLNVPGVTASAGGVTSVVFGPSVHDSVDADDGLIDGSGLGGDSFFSTDGGTGISFSFDGTLLGSLPTSAGIVWTDGASGQITFEAFDENGLSLGSLLGSHSDGSVVGETAEDRFYGATNAGGISRIFISTVGGGLEVDHLQYGDASPDVNHVPDSTSTLGSLAFAVAGLVALRRRRSRADR